MTNNSGVYLGERFGRNGAARPRQDSEDKKSISPSNVLGITDANRTKGHRGSGRRSVRTSPTEHRIFVHRKREKSYKEMDQGVQERELVIDLTFYPDTDSGGAEFNLCTRSGKRTGL